MDEDRKEYWCSFVSDLPDLFLIHDLIFIRRMLDSPEVVESELLDFFDDFYDMIVKELFLRYVQIVMDG